MEKERKDFLNKSVNQPVAQTLKMTAGRLMEFFSERKPAEFFVPPQYIFCPGHSFYFDIRAVSNIITPSESSSLKNRFISLPDTV